MSRGTKTDETGVYRKDDGRYLVVAAAKDPDTGKMVHRQRTLPEGAGLTDAVALRKDLMDQIRTPTTPESQILRLTDYCERWMRRKVSRLKPKTARTYATALGDRVCEVEVLGDMLGELPVEELTREHVLAWCDWAESQTHPDGTPYATATIRKWWRVFKQVLRDLEADGHLDKDLTRRIRPLETGRRGVREEKALTAEQLRDVVDCARNETPKRYAEICTLAYTGMRSGELWGLKWDAVDHDRGVIEIKRSVSDGVLTETTKAHWDREVPLAEEVSEAIRAHRRRMMESQHPGLESGLVFPADTGNPRTAGSLRKAFGTITDELGLGRSVSPQTLRKTWVTLVALAGVDRLVLRSVVGHRDEEMTEHYAQIGREPKRAAVDTLAQQMGGDSR